MHDANPRACRQTTRGLGGAKWILDLAQMADHGDVEATRPPVMHTRQRHSRLMHDANLTSKPCGHAPSRELLQRNEPIGACERAQSRRRIAIDIVVDVSAAQTHDQRSIGVKLAKVPDAVRAAPRVEVILQICGGSMRSVGNTNTTLFGAQEPCA